MLARNKNHYRNLVIAATNFRVSLIMGLVNCQTFSSHITLNPVSNKIGG